MAYLKTVFVLSLSFACLSVTSSCRSGVRNSSSNPRISIAGFTDDNGLANGPDDKGCTGSFNLFTASSLMRDEPIVVLSSTGGDERPRIVRLAYRLRVSLGRAAVNERFGFYRADGTCCWAVYPLAGFRGEPVMISGGGAQGLVDFSGTGSVRLEDCRR